MRPDRIADLLQPFLGPANAPRITEESLNRISIYIDILLRWNARINLTAIRNEEEIVTRHFGESFFAARHLFPSASMAPATSANVGTASLRVADLGSGAGFPGVPIKLWAPQAVVTLIESNQKKATFLREVIRSLTLTGINVQTARAETLIPTSFDVVTIRAVERLANILPVAAALLAPYGHLALLISASQVPGVLSNLPALSWQAPIPIPQSKSRILLIGQAPG